MHSNLSFIHKLFKYFFFAFLLLPFQQNCEIKETAKKRFEMKNLGER